MFTDLLETFNKNKKIQPNSEENLKNIYNESSELMKEKMFLRNQEDLNKQLEGLPEDTKQKIQSSINVEQLKSKLKNNADDTLYSVFVVFASQYILFTERINELNSKVSELQNKVLELESKLNNNT